MVTKIAIAFSMICCLLDENVYRGKYWDKVDEQCKRKPSSIMLADKNAPNEEVWLRIEEMCRRTRASAVPVVSNSEGTETNPFSLDALAVFIFRVLHRVNHPGNLDKSSQNAGYVLLMFYNLYDGKSRKEFEGELIERFGLLVKMPLLKPDRGPLLDSVKSILEEGINLYQLHQRRHGATNNDMLRLHIELKGPFPKKMLRKGAFTEQHFDQDLNFLATEEDPVTKKTMKRLILSIKPKDIGVIVMSSPREDPKMSANFRNLLQKIFVLDPDKRITVSQALSHPFIGFLLHEMAEWEDFVFVIFLLACLRFLLHFPLLSFPFLESM